MEVHLSQQTESCLQELAGRTGRAADELVENAMAGYLLELTRVRETLDARYEDHIRTRVSQSFAEDVRALPLRRQAELA
jgi:hypothetical protein